jgi:hypothetical protein
MLKIWDHGKVSQLTPTPAYPHKIYLNLYPIGARVLLNLGQGNP